MVNFAYRGARLKGQLTRWWYRHRLEHWVNHPITNHHTLNATVYCLSCERDLPEQIACLRSFLRYVGMPQKFVIVSDGSYSVASLRLLEQLHACVEVVALMTFVNPELPPPVFDYLRTQSMGKKLGMILSIPIQVGSASIYTDADICFFPGAIALRELINTPDQQSYFLADRDPAFDERLLQPGESQNPVNGGFLLFKSPPNWQLALDRFLALTAAPNYFTEQTIMHLTLHQMGAKALASTQYIMERDDEFHWRDRYAGDAIVLRHYVTPVRHKFWGNWQYLR